jgi:hypothetical protein
VRRTFRAKLETEGPGAAWTFLRVPFDVEEMFGTRARVSVKGTINGFAFRSSIVPTGNGGHQMVVNKQMQSGAGARLGDTVRVEIAVDKVPRAVVAPPELKAALARNHEASEAYSALAPSHRKAFAEWVREAKKPETKARRAEKTIEMLLENKRLR